MQKTAYLFLLAFITSLSVLAQKGKEIQWPSMPIDEKTELINYTDVVQLANVTDDEMYDRAIKWFNSYYKNPAEKLRKTDKENGEIEAFIRFKIYNKDKNGVQASDAGLVQFNIFLTFKDGRYKYSITNFNLQKQSYFALEQWFDKTDATADKHADYLTQVDEEIKKTIKEMKAGISDKGPKAEEDW